MRVELTEDQKQSRALAWAMVAHLRTLRLPGFYTVNRIQTNQGIGWSIAYHP
jgi:hypothetical protein